MVMLLLAVSACGDSTRAERTAPSSTTHQPTTAAPSIASATDTTLPEFVFTAETSVGLLPPEHYEVAPCEQTATGRQAGEVHPDISYSGSHIDTVGELINEIDTAFVGTVVEPLPSMLITPVNLPSNYLEATGMTSGADMTWGLTPTVLSVDQLVMGTPDSTVVTSELGCFATDSIALLRPGTRILMLANTVDSRLGPSSFYDGTHSAFEWFEVEDSDRLLPRYSLLGLPSEASFFEGMTLNDAVAQLSAEAR